MSNANSNLIHFQNPPLNEVVFGVWFSNVNWSITHYGKYHSVIAESYPTTTTVNPIAPPGSLGLPTAGLKFLTSPELPRVWYEGKDPAFILQIQPDRMLVNWRKRSDSKTEYPHFDFLFKRFTDEWEKFTKFCSSEKIGTPVIAGFDLTYINHFVQGKDWNTPQDLAHYFSHLDCLKHFPDAKVFGLDIAYPVRNFLVRTSIKRGSLVQERKDVFIVELGISNMSTPVNSFKDFASSANDILVNEFLRVTTKEAHSRWGLING